jgi:hypothetical protein
LNRKPEINYNRLYPIFEETVMRAVVRSVVTALSIASLSVSMTAAPIAAAFAQNAQPDASQPAPKQIALTEKQIEAILATKPDIDPIISKLPEGNDQPDPKVLAQLDAVVKKHGFANYAEYEDVDDNINLVLGGIDPQSKKYVGDEMVLKKEIAEVQGDKKMAPNDKKEALTQLNDALKSITPVQFPANIPLVVKYYAKFSQDSPQDQ